MLARFEGGEHDLPVRVAGRNHIDQTDVVPRDEPAVIRLVGRPAQGSGGLAYAGLVAPADGGHARRGIHVEEAPDLAVGVGVGAAHELVTNEPDPDLCHAYSSLAKAASKACVDGSKSVRRANARASLAPYSRSIPESSHSMLKGPP